MNQILRKRKQSLRSKVLDVFFHLSHQSELHGSHLNFQFVTAVISSGVINISRTMASRNTKGKRIQKVRYTICKDKIITFDNNKMPIGSCNHLVDPCNSFGIILFTRFSVFELLTLKAPLTSTETIWFLNSETRIHIISMTFMQTCVSYHVCKVQYIKQNDF